MAILLPVSQQRLVAMAPKPTAVTSLVCAVVVAVHVLVSKERRSRPYHRISLAISVHVILHALALCFGTAAVPLDSQPPIYGAAGNITTCNAQGFVSFGSRFSLTLYFLLLPLCLFPAPRFTESLMHLFCNAIPMAFSIVALRSRYFNPIPGGAFCDIHVAPDGCAATNACIRGDAGTEILFHLSAACRIISLIVGLTALGKGCCRIRSGLEDKIPPGSLWSILGPMTILTLIGFFGYTTAMFSRSPNTFSFHMYIAFMILWPSVGIIHIISYWNMRYYYTLYDLSQSQAFATVADTESQVSVTMDSLRPEIVNLQLQWSALENVQYFASGGNAWIHSALLDKKNVVIKILKPEYQSCAVAKKELDDELDVLTKLRHPNICTLFGAGYTSRRSRFLVLERLEGGTLAQKLDRMHKLTYHQVLHYARDIAAAMSYCHGGEQSINGILVHRDLKPGNIGFTSSGIIKIFDFGLCRIIPNAVLHDTGLYEMSECGSWRYMAPEIATSKRYNHKVDVYSFSIILWEMMSLKKPFDGMTKEEMYEKVFLVGERPVLHDKWPPCLVKLIVSCWSPNPASRPNFIDIHQTLNAMIRQEAEKKRGRSFILQKYTAESSIVK